jgi:hypothetical protein
LTKALDLGVMKKIDFKKELKAFYAPSAKAPAMVTVPPLQYLMVDGEGDPNSSPAYIAAVQALFTLSYTLKFMAKKGPQAIDYGVMPLEGLWWADDPLDFENGRKDRWKWTAMIMQPDFITLEMVQEATEAVRKKKNPVALPLVRFERWEEGKSAQILYFGPYAEENATIRNLHAFIISQKGRLRGKHHEIYLNDPRKVAPEKLKTVIRQPST